MTPDDNSVEIVVCLGSSCFARGNSENLAILQKYVQIPGSSISVRLTGKLCQDQCKDGPNLMIGRDIYHNVTPAKLRELLQHVGQATRGDHGTA